MPHVPNVLGSKGTLTVLKRHDVTRCIVVLLKVKGKDALCGDDVCPSVCGPVSAATWMVGFFKMKYGIEIIYKNFTARLSFVKNRSVSVVSELRL
jgi:hypothetical protein